MSGAPTPSPISPAPGNTCPQAVWVTDAAYAHGTGLSILSASRQTPADAVLTVVMPPDDLARTDWSPLRAALRPNHALRTLAAADPRIERCALASDYITRTTYLRFLLPELLPDAARCIYLDGDILVMDDLSLLWNEMDPVAPVSAARDLCIAAEGTYMRSLGLTSYFNSGVMGLNLQAWRACGDTGACLRLAASLTRKHQYQDQDVLNLLFADRVGWLHPRWNILGTITGIYAYDAHCVSRTEWLRMRTQPGIAHYTGPRKPWHGDMSHWLAWKYWEAADQSPWRAEYAPRRAEARRRYLACRAKHLRRWVARFAHRREHRKAYLMLCGRKIELG